jgi:hypothetical protein
MAMSEQRPFHRLFGLSWIDFFRGTAVEVDTEVDLSRKQQLLDLVIIHKGAVAIPWPLPDGFEDLATNNLVTFKSHQQALDAWALFELIGHYVNYRKQYSPTLQDLLPESDYKLFAVCVRFPQQLAQQVALTPVQPGVFDVRFASLTIRIIVVHGLPLEEQNAMLHLFSAQEVALRYGQEHFRPRSQETSSLLLQLWRVYKEDPTMPDKLQEFVRQTIDELLRSLPPEKRMEGLPPEERLKGLSPEEQLRALSPEAREALVRELKANGPATNPQ